MKPTSCSLANVSLPDFCGNEEFWKAYPALLGRSFTHISTPFWFQTEPRFAWGFFGHRLGLYRSKAPHEGFALLRRWAERTPGGYFIFTSNVDDHFQKAGFSEMRILECHGSIHLFQCATRCTRTIWPADEMMLEIDEESVRCLSELPRCEICRGIARPNILMFGDGDWLPERCREQEERYAWWQREVRGSRVVAIEIGAGLAIPTVRMECERQGRILNRINPREAQTNVQGISIPLGGLVALSRIERLLEKDP